MPESPLSSKPQIDTSDFKTGTAAMNRELRILETGFKASAASLGDWTKSATGLEMRVGTLNEKIEIQKQKVAATRAEYERLKAENGEDARATQEMEIKLNQEVATLGKMQFELTDTTANLDEMRKGSQEAGKGMDEASRKGITLIEVLAGVKKVADGVKVAIGGVATVIKTEFAVAVGILKVGIGAVIGLGAVALATTALIGGLGLKAATTADQLGELSDKTGISVTRLQELSFIGKIVGTDVESIATSNARLIRSMAAAADGTGPQAEAFKTLGIRVRDAHGDLRSANTVFGEALDALGKIQNPTERDALAMQIFGKSAQELNPLIKLGSSGMEVMARRAQELGAIVSTETTTALGDLKDNTDALTSGMQGFGMTLLGALAPLAGGLLQNATGLWKEFIGTIRTGDTVDLTKIPEAVGNIGTKIVQGLAEAMPQIATTGVEILKAIGGSFSANLPALLQAGQDILKAITDAITQNLPLIADAAPEILTQIANALLAVLPVLFDVGAQIILTLIDVMAQALPGLLPKMAQTGLQIMQQLLTAVQTAFPVLMELAPQILQALIGFLRTNLVQLVSIGIPLISRLIQAVLPALPLLVDAALKILVALANALASQLPTLTPAIVQVITQIILVIAQNLPMLIHAALTILSALADGIVAALPILIEALPVIVTAILDALRLALPDIARAAGEILVTLGSGIGTNIYRVVAAAGKILKAIYDTIGPAASVKLMMDIADGMIKGLNDGWTAHWEEFKANVLAGFDDMVTWIKDLLGIKSPSKVFGEIGKNSILGFSNAFFNGLDQVQRDANRVFAGFAGGTAAAMGGLSSTDNSQHFGPFFGVTIEGNATPGSLGDILKGRRY